MADMSPFRSPLDPNPDSLFGASAVRLPPNAVEAEQALLGALLSNNKALKLCEGLRSEHFAEPAHAMIFEKIKRGVDAGHAVSVVTLDADLRGAALLDVVGGRSYLTALLAAMVGIINTGDYARVIIETWEQRQTIEMLEERLREAWAPGNGSWDLEQLIAELSADLGRVAGNSGKATDVSMDEAIDRALDDTRRTAGIMTGFSTIDDRTDGLQPGCVYVIGGRPGSGKSALGHQICLHAARNGKRVHQEALEMSAKDLGARTLSMMTGIALKRIKRRWEFPEEAEALVLARKELRGLPMTFNEEVGKTVDKVAASIMRRHRKTPVDLIMVDHLNLIRGDDQGNRNGSTFIVEQASGRLLEVAKRCNVPLLLLAQLNREADKRDDHRPMMADLRQAGAIEQDAHAICFVYREEMYLSADPPVAHPRENDEKYNERVVAHERRLQDSRGRAEFVWAKNRGGEPGNDKVYFHGPTTSFHERAPQ
jgi:replicative DNA helicase